MTDKYDKPILLRVTEAAEILHISKSLVYELIKQNLLPYIKINSMLRVPLEALREWIEQRTVGAAADRMKGLNKFPGGTSGDFADLDRPGKPLRNVAPVGTVNTRDANVMSQPERVEAKALPPNRSSWSDQFNCVVLDGEPPQFVRENLKRKSRSHILQTWVGCVQRILKSSIDTTRVGTAPAHTILERKDQVDKSSVPEKEFHDAPEATGQHGWTEQIGLQGST